MVEGRVYYNDTICYVYRGYIRSPDLSLQKQCIVRGDTHHYFHWHKKNNNNMLCRQLRGFRTQSLQADLAFREYIVLRRHFRESKLQRLNMKLKEGTWIYDAPKVDQPQWDISALYADGQRSRLNLFGNTIPWIYHTSKWCMLFRLCYPKFQNREDSYI